MAALSPSELRVFRMLKTAIEDGTAVLVRLRLHGQERACLGSQLKHDDGSTELTVFGLLLTPQERDELKYDLERVLERGEDDKTPESEPEVHLPPEVAARCVVLDNEDGLSLDDLYQDFNRLVDQARNEPPSGLRAQFTDPKTGRVYTLAPMLHTFAHPADEALEEGECSFCGESLVQVDPVKGNTDDDWWCCPTCGSQWADGGRFRPPEPS